MNLIYSSSKAFTDFNTQVSNMPDKTTIEKASESEYIDDVLQKLSNETHKKIIKAYRGEDPVSSMESKLGKIIMAIVNRED